jgi:hypothetical protein
MWNALVLVFPMQFAASIDVETFLLNTQWILAELEPGDAAQTHDFRFFDFEPVFNMISAINENTSISNYNARLTEAAASERRLEERHVRAVSVIADLRALNRAVPPDKRTSLLDTWGSHEAELEAMRVETMRSMARADAQQTRNELFRDYIVGQMSIMFAVYHWGTADDQRALVLELRTGGRRLVEEYNALNDTQHYDGKPELMKAVGIYDVPRPRPVRAQITAAATATTAPPLPIEARQTSGSSSSIWSTASESPGDDDYQDGADYEDDAIGSPSVSSDRLSAWSSAVSSSDSMYADY